MYFTNEKSNDSNAYSNHRLNSLFLLLSCVGYIVEDSANSSTDVTVFKVMALDPKVNLWIVEPIWAERISMALLKDSLLILDCLEELLPSEFCFLRTSQIDLAIFFSMSLYPS